MTLELVKRMESAWPGAHHFLNAKTSPSWAIVSMLDPLQVPVNTVAPAAAKDTCWPVLEYVPELESLCVSLIDPKTNRIVETT